MPNEGRTIRVALAGTPNSGKTSLFNLLTGLHQQVGNWPGVTVERKTGRVAWGGCRCEVVDLPGTYSLTAYSLEERIAREFILDARPDVVVNVVDSANLERHLFLTTQLLEMGVDVVVALNMWDEFQRSGAQLDLARLQSLLGTPVVTTIAHRGRGREALLDAIVRLVEQRTTVHRHVPISFGTHVERLLVDLTQRIADLGPEELPVPPRYLATKLLEGDPHVVALLHNRLPAARPLLAAVEGIRAHITQAAGLEPARLIAEGRRGFIAGLLREVLVSQSFDRMEFSRGLDGVLTHRWFGFPIFLAFMWLLFNATFALGAYPQHLIEWLVAQAQLGTSLLLPAGLLRSLLVDGIIGGVGSVAVFLPNILLLFLGVSVLEDTGYMARSAFIMDRVMHLLGLHGKSFIPMLMGFGCSVPAIMATRTLENRRDRILTALLVPHMSCSARLPVYILFAGAFFGRQAGNVVAIVYLVGILVAVAIGHLFSRTIFRHADAAFVMELPPYRWPTLRGLLIHMWERGRHYLKKMGGVILIASVVLWALSTFPQVPATQPVPTAEPRAAAAELTPTESAPAVHESTRRDPPTSPEPIEYAVVGRIGKAIAPVLAPLGFNWQMGVTLIAGFVAKEVVVSSLAVLYEVGESPLAASEAADGMPHEASRGPARGGGERTADSQEGLVIALRDPANGITPLTALAFMIFVLLYTPCIVTVLTIGRELGNRWMWFDVAYQLLLAWSAAFIVYQGGRLLGLG